MSWLFSDPLPTGTQAPAFSLPDDSGHTVSLAALQGKNVVLVFYPGDNTPVCRAQLCEFRDRWEQAKMRNILVFGINPGDAQSHTGFREKNHLPFPLLSDPQGHTAAAYAALFQLGPLRVARRQTFIVTPEGRIGRVYRHVDPTRHAMEVAQALKDLQNQHLQTGLSQPPK